MLKERSGTLRHVTEAVYCRINWALARPACESPKRPSGNPCILPEGLAWTALPALFSKSRDPGGFQRLGRVSHRPFEWSAVCLTAEAKARQGNRSVPLFWRAHVHCSKTGWLNQLRLNHMRISLDLSWDQIATMGNVLEPGLA